MTYAYASNPSNMSTGASASAYSACAFNTSRSNVVMSTALLAVLFVILGFFPLVSLIFPVLMISVLLIVRITLCDSFRKVSFKKVL